MIENITLLTANSAESPKYMKRLVIIMCSTAAHIDMKLWHFFNKKIIDYYAALHSTSKMSIRNCRLILLFMYVTYEPYSGI
jgi:hypothetical protein